MTDTEYKQIAQLRAPVDLDLNLPGSKSISLRNLALAGMADGESTLHAAGDCDDVWRMEACLRKLGIPVRREDRTRLIVEGRGGRFSGGTVALDVGLSATSARFLIAMAALRTEATLLDGHASMRARPNGVLVEALQSMGASCQADRHGYLPMTLTGPSAPGNRASMKGDVSSQYFSALMLIAPLLPRGLDLHVEGELVSRPYVEITIREMERFGVEVRRPSPAHFQIAPQRYRATETLVEGDASAASYFAALATLGGSRVRLKNLGRSTSQGDYRFLEVCEQLGASVQRSDSETTIVGPDGGDLQPLSEVDMEHMPDVAPTLMAMAPFVPGATRITGLATLRIKECDRIAVPVNQLRKLGVRIEEGPEHVVVHGLQAPGAPSAPLLATHDDHRMAMSFAVIGSRLGGVRIADPGCVGKTYPAFWEDLARLYPAQG